MFLNRHGSFNQGHQIAFLTSKFGRYKRFFNSDEMERNGDGEGIAFGSFAKGHKKYGSMTRRQKREQEVEYNVQSGDTLQGIAIKFGITTSDIRRANHLWTNDSLFLRDKLLIPGNSAKISQSSTLENLNNEIKLSKFKGSSLILFDDLPLNDEDTKTPLGTIDLNSPQNCFNSPSQLNELNSNEPLIESEIERKVANYLPYENQSETTPAEFLSKIDRVIASSIRRKKQKL